MSLTLEYQSLSELIYKDISSRIISGQYQPGEQLVENTLQERYSVSKAPIREAFQMLINDQLVERRPRRGCFVKTPEEKQIKDIYEIRLLLESYAASKAYERLDKSDVKKLRESYDEMEKAAKNNDRSAYYICHDVFQSFFSNECGNDVIAEHCQKLRAQNRWYHMQFFHTDLIEDFHTHDKLLEHFEKHDVTPYDIQVLMQEHIKIGLANYDKYLVSTKLS